MKLEILTTDRAKRIAEHVGCTLEQVRGVWEFARGERDSHTGYRIAGIPPSHPACARCRPYSDICNCEVDP